MTTLTEHTTLVLREMLLRGEFSPGEKLREERLAASLGVSRMPLRAAMQNLVNEGLLETSPHRGMVVRKFTVEQIEEALDVRGCLEGMACRIAAEKGISEDILRDLERCLQVGDEIFAKGYIVEEDAHRLSENNVRFHSLTIEAADNEALANALSIIDNMPMASPGAIPFDALDLDFAFFMTFEGHRQHHQIVDALKRAQSSRAEACLREHWYAARLSTRKVIEEAQRRNVDNRDGLKLVELSVQGSVARPDP